MIINHCYYNKKIIKNHGQIMFILSDNNRFTMKKLTKILVSSIIGLSSMGANAELISYDYKNAGDDDVTLDSATGIEWLDTSVTKGLSVNEVTSLLETTLNGWRWATATEVNRVTDSAHPYLNVNRIGNVISNNSTTYSGAVKEFNYLFSDLDVDGSASYRTKDYLGIDKRIDITATSKYYININIYTSGLSDDYVNDNYGHLLVSDGGYSLSSIQDPTLNINNPNSPVNTVPVPATLGLLSLVIAGLSFRRKSA
jgi:hypothetical protein